MISIHLRRTGASRDPHYRVVVSDNSAARDGAFIEVLGHYHPRFQPARVVLDVERTKAWIARGAQPSDTVRSLLRKVESGKIELVSEEPAETTTAATATALPVAAADTAEPLVEPEAKAEAEGAEAEAGPKEGKAGADEGKATAEEDEKQTEAGEAKSAEGDEPREDEAADASDPNGDGDDKDTETEKPAESDN